MGTYLRRVRIPVEDIDHFEQIAHERGWVIEDCSKEKEYLENLPRKDYSEEEWREIEQTIKEESADYRRQLMQQGPNRPSFVDKNQ